MPVATYASLVIIGAAYALASWAMISFHNAVARYMFALGRERVLPAALARTEPRTGAPRVASLTQSAVGLVVIAVYAWPAGTRWSGCSSGAAPPGPSGSCVAAVIGVLYGLWLRSARPDVYQGVGLGADTLESGSRE